MDNTPKAIEILEGILVSHPQLVNEEIINILAELCILSKAYEQVYEVHLITFITILIITIIIIMFFYVGHYWILSHGAPASITRRS